MNSAEKNEAFRHEMTFVLLLASEAVGKICAATELHLFYLSSSEEKSDRWLGKVQRNVRTCQTRDGF